MPKTLWLPGGTWDGKPGGGRHETFWTADEVADRELAAEARGRNQERMHRKNDEAAAAKLSDVMYDRSRVGMSGNLNRPYPNPKALQNHIEEDPTMPVDAPNWTTPLRIALGILAVVVVVILAVVL